MYERIITAATDAVWCITETKLDEIWTFLDRAASGVSIDGAALEMLIVHRRDRAAPNVKRSIGVLPIVGTISHRASLLDESSGGVSTEQIGRDFDTLMSSDDVGSVLMEIDSPGGTYPGIPELADKIAAARDVKPVVAHINAEAGSGALWLASAAGEVVITPSGSAGSVGAYIKHEDQSVLDEAIGVKHKYISYGKYKTEESSHQPLPTETEEFLQDHVNQIGKEFEAALSRFRGVPLGTVRKDFGQGRMLDAKQALEAGMVDRIGTMEDTITRLASGKSKPTGRRVENARLIMRM